MLVFVVSFQSAAD
uniref:Uncharacterized protein n=1 Tax=Anguilla anguilla TaxID=7936 RepID=A0A0E9QXI9_ANGAN